MEAHSSGPFLRARGSFSLGSTLPGGRFGALVVRRGFLQRAFRELLYGRLKFRGCCSGLLCYCCRWCRLQFFGSGCCGYIPPLRLLSWVVLLRDLLKDRTARSPSSPVPMIDMSTLERLATAVPALRRSRDNDDERHPCSTRLLSSPVQKKRTLFLWFWCLACYSVSLTATRETSFRTKADSVGTPAQSATCCRRFWF